MDELKKKLEDLLEAHTKKMVVSCDENCMCWEIESLLCDLDMQAEKSRPTPRELDLLSGAAKSAGLAQPANQ